MTAAQHFGDLIGSACFGFAMGAVAMSGFVVWKEKRNERSTRHASQNTGGRA